MKRRELITVFGGVAATWPLVAHAQQPAMPVIGFFDPRMPEPITDRLRGFHQGLKDADLVEGENVAILYRYAEYQLARLPGLAVDLIRRQVSALVTGGGPATLAAKAATDWPHRAAIAARRSRRGHRMMDAAQHRVLAHRVLSLLDRMAEVEGDTAEIWDGKVLDAEFPDPIATRNERGLRRDNPLTSVAKTGTLTQPAGRVTLMKRDLNQR